MKIQRIALLYILILLCAGSSFGQSGEVISWREALHQEKEWYSSEEAQRIAGNVLLYQNNNGGWSKNVDMAAKLSAVEKDRLRKNKSKDIGTTIDNGATHTQLRYLAKVIDATGKEEYKEAFLEGVDFLLEAQYDNGGWPQFYPIKKGYYEHITYNDGAMIGVMDLLRRIARNDELYSFVDRERKERAEQAIDKGLEVILATQVRVDDELTIWAAQHDKDDFSPAKARAYELPSLSGKESVGIVEYLMELENPSEEVKRSVRSAVQWFDDNKITGKKVVWLKDPTSPKGRDRKMIEDPSGGPLWGRFNEIGTNRAIFVGRDGVVKYNLNEIERERRINYNYIDNYAEDLLNTDYPEWEDRNKNQE